MWKLLVTTAILANLGAAQRSSYAPRAGSNSKLLPRYRKNETDAGLGTRGAEEEFEVSSTLPPELQGTLEDNRFVQRVSQWPEDRQPFWFKNRNAISYMRDKNIDGGNTEQATFENQRPRPQFRSSFQGAGRGKGRGRSQDKGRGNGVAQFRDYDGFESHPFAFDPRRTFYG